MPKGEETRHRIVAEAAAMFNKNGFEGSSRSLLIVPLCRVDFSGHMRIATSHW